MDRFIVMATLYDIPVGIVINKTDLIDETSEEAVAFWAELYRNLGYDVLGTSVETGEGVAAFGKWLQGRTSVLIGPSGAGKSSLLNAVEPELGLRIGEVSSRTRKGTHTTTFAALYPLSGGGFVADTPGLREYGLIDLDPEMLCHYFVEMKQYIPECRYPNCTHDHEPGCRVKEAVEAGEISIERYESYLNMLFSLRMGEKDVGR
jgi:ribosome biogenesis GTPase